MFARLSAIAGLLVSLYTTAVFENTVFVVFG